MTQDKQKEQTHIKRQNQVLDQNLKGYLNRMSQQMQRQDQIIDYAFS